MEFAAGACGKRAGRREPEQDTGVQMLVGMGKKQDGEGLKVTGEATGERKDAKCIQDISMRHAGVLKVPTASQQQVNWERSQLHNCSGQRAPSRAQPPKDQPRRQ